MSENKNKTNNDEIKIVNDTPVPFKQSASTEYLTKTELCDLVNGMMKGIFADCFGCVISPTPYGQLSVDVLFRHDDSNNDAVQATEKISKDNSENSNQIMAAIGTLSASSFNRKMFNLTDFAKKALAKFMIPENGFISDQTGVYPATTKIGRGGVNWHARVQYIDYEGTQLVKVIGFSIEALIGFIHGTEIDGHVMQYNARIERPISHSFGFMNGQLPLASQDFLIRIDQADANEIAELVSKVSNVIPSMNSPIGGVIRA